MNKLLSLLFLSFFLNAEESRMTPLLDLIQDDDWMSNEKTQLYIMQRCLSINAGIAQGTRTDKNEKMLKESSVKADFFLDFAINLYSSTYPSNEPRQEFEIQDIIIQRAVKMFGLYASYMEEDYMLLGNPYGEPLMGDRNLCDALYSLDRIE